MGGENVVISPNNDLDESAGKESVQSGDLSLENDISSPNNAGRISLEFIDGDSDTYGRYPSSYYTFSAKERLMLIFTENFRRQFIATYPTREPLVLAIPNECGIQKFVSTTVRPTSFLFHELIDCWEGPAQFVCDFMTYAPLDNPLELVSK